MKFKYYMFFRLIIYATVFVFPLETRTAMMNKKSRMKISYNDLIEVLTYDDPIKEESYEEYLKEIKKKISNRGLGKYIEVKDNTKKTSSSIKIMSSQGFCTIKISNLEIIIPPRENHIGGELVDALNKENPLSFWGKSGVEFFNNIIRGKEYRRSYSTSSRSEFPLFPIRLYDVKFEKNKFYDVHLSVRANTINLKKNNFNKSNNSITVRTHLSGLSKEDYPRGKVVLLRNKFDYISIDTYSPIRIEQKNKINLIANTSQNGTFIAKDVYIGPEESIDRKGKHPHWHKEIFFDLFRKAEARVDKGQQEILQLRIDMCQLHIDKKEVEGVNIIERLNLRIRGFKLWTRSLDSNPFFKFILWILKRAIGFVLIVTGFKLFYS